MIQNNILFNVYKIFMLIKSLATHASSSFRRRRVVAAHQIVDTSKIVRAQVTEAELRLKKKYINAI